MGKENRVVPTTYTADAVVIDETEAAMLDQQGMAKEVRGDMTVYTVPDHIYERRVADRRAAEKRRRRARAAQRRRK